MMSVLIICKTEKLKKKKENLLWGHKDYSFVIHWKSFLGVPFFPLYLYINSKENMGLVKGL
jgi:hypothetical protein